MKRRVSSEELRVNDFDGKQRLEDDGFLTLTEKDFDEIELQHIVTAASELSQENITSHFGTKRFWRQLGSEHGLSANSILVKFALQKSILSRMAEYLNEWPLLNSVQLVQSVGLDESFKSSQLWHVDHEDTKVVKLFVYLNDVLEKEQGPFCFFDKKKTRSMRLQYSPVHKSDEVIEKKRPAYDFESIFGPVGTSFMIDTKSCLHRGSRLQPGKSRLVYIATFTTPYRMVPRRQQISVAVDDCSIAHNSISVIDF
ncbi:hypothetical protein OAL14_00350 [Gammaproteobacteria bacterium]|nr:hypothetical protein [Gammaproteobacteria bacterium]